MATWREILHPLYLLLDHLVGVVSVEDHLSAALLFLRSHSLIEMIVFVANDRGNWFIMGILLLDELLWEESLNTLEFLLFFSDVVRWKDHLAYFFMLSPFHSVFEVVHLIFTPSDFNIRILTISLLSSLSFMLILKFLLGHLRKKVLVFLW